MTTGDSHVNNFSTFFFCWFCCSTCIFCCVGWYWMKMKWEISKISFCWISKTILYTAVMAVEGKLNLKLPLNIKDFSFLPSTSPKNQVKWQLGCNKGKVLESTWDFEASYLSNFEKKKIWLVAEQKISIISHCYVSWVLSKWRSAQNCIVQLHELHF